MHLKRIKVPKRPKDDDEASEKLDGASDEEMADGEGVGVEQGACTSGEHQAMAVDQQVEEEVSKAMQQLSTTQFVPRSVRMNRSK
jgi:hypothetical protein